MASDEDDLLYRIRDVMRRRSRGDDVPRLADLGDVKFGARLPAMLRRIAVSKNDCSSYATKLVALEWPSDPKTLSMISEVAWYDPRSAAEALRFRNAELGAYNSESKRLRSTHKAGSSPLRSPPSSQSMSQSPPPSHDILTPPTALPFQHGAEPSAESTASTESLYAKPHQSAVETKLQTEPQADATAVMGTPVSDHTMPSSSVTEGVGFDAEVVCNDTSRDVRMNLRHSHYELARDACAPPPDRVMAALIRRVPFATVTCIRGVVIHCTAAPADCKWITSVLDELAFVAMDDGSIASASASGGSSSSSSSGSAELAYLPSTAQPLSDAFVASFAEQRFSSMTERLSVRIHYEDSAMSWELHIAKMRDKFSEPAAREAYALETVMAAFPTTTVGGYVSAATALSSPLASTQMIHFISLPDSVTSAHVEFVDMVCRSLCIAQSTIQRVSIQCKPLNQSLPVIGGKLWRKQGSTPEVSHEPLPYTGEITPDSDDDESHNTLSDGSFTPASISVTSASNSSAVTPESPFGCTRSSTIGAVIESLKFTSSSSGGSERSTLALTAGHLVDNVESAWCEAKVHAQSSTMKLQLQYIAHSDPSNYDVTRTALFSMPNTPDVVHREVADISLYNFVTSADTAPIDVVPTEAAGGNGTCLFPDRNFFGKDVAVRGHGRATKSERKGPREHVCVGWVSTPTECNPAVRNSLYLARAAGPLSYGHGHSGCPVYYNSRLHSFVNWKIPFRVHGRPVGADEEELIGLTPAPLALQQARALLLSGSESQLLVRYVDRPLPPPQQQPQPANAAVQSRGCIIT